MQTEVTALCRSNRNHRVGTVQSTECTRTAFKPKLPPRTCCRELNVTRPPFECTAIVITAILQQHTSRSDRRTRWLGAADRVRKACPAERRQVPTRSLQYSTGNRAVRGAWCTPLRTSTVARLRSFRFPRRVGVVFGRVPLQGRARYTVVVIRLEGAVAFGCHCSPAW